MYVCVYACVCVCVCVYACVCVWWGDTFSYPRSVLNPAKVSSSSVSVQYILRNSDYKNKFVKQHTRNCVK